MPLLAPAKIASPLLCQTTFDDPSNQLAVVVSQGPPPPAPLIPKVNGAAMAGAIKNANNIKTKAQSLNRNCCFGPIEDATVTLRTRSRSAKKCDMPLLPNETNE